TNLALSPSSVAENQPTATVVGTLSSTDQDAGAAHTYTLVTGAGDADNGAFTITGTTLKTAAIFDFEAKSSYSIRVKTDDGAGGTFEKQFTITVTNVNEAPTDIALSNASVTENQPTNTDVGTFSTTDPDSGDTFAYTLATGTGDDDNGSFTISGNTLKTNAVFDKEAKSSYSIRVQTQDQGGTGLTFQKQFTVSIDDVNDAPTLTAIEATALPYDTGDPGSPITSTLTTGDVDNANLKSGTVKIDTGYLNGSDTLSFAGTATISSGGFDVTTGTLSLTTGAGGAPKSEWDTALQSVKFFSAGPTPSGSRTIRFQVDDGQASDHASNVASRDITVTNDNVAPTDILLSNDTTASGQPSGQTVGTLSSVDSDAGDPHTYTLVSGTGSTDNGSFQITGSTLKTNATLTAADYSIRVKTDDGRGGTFEKALTIHVIDDLSPTDITLSNSSIDENGSAGDDVGTLTSTDSDGGPTFTYTLVSGTGSTDNSLFQINGDKLEAAGPLDFEAAGTRSVRIKTYDGKGGSFEKQFTITINNKNDAPTDISLSNSSVAENTGDNADVGTLSSTDQDAGATHSYTLVTGTGDTDNGKFQISGTMLKTAQNLDFETQSSYSVRVKTDDGAGGTFEKQFTITVTNANDAPSDITLQNSTVAENQLAPATVGGLVTTDQDSADTSFTYTFATGTGDDDNLKFQLSGNTLQTNAVFDYETKSTYKVRLKTDDGHGGTFEKAFTVTVTDVNDPPTNIALSSSSVNENQPTGTTVGNFSSTDQDVPANTFTYTFATGTGDDDNGSFTISGNQLKTGASFDFEAKASYKIRVKTDDGHGGTFEKAFTVTVTDVNDPPTDIALSKQDINENQSSASNVGTFSSTDQDVPANTFTYTLVSGTGSADNGSFTISGGTLKTAASFNFEVKNSYSIRVQTDDGHGGTFQKQFTITINDVNDAPTTVQDDYSGAIGNTKAQVGTSSSGPVVTLSGSIPLANDSDEDATFPHTVSAVPETVSSSGGGSATINADGSFTYLPGVGDKNLANDTFTYHATDGSLTSPGTATVD
ncbi:MAG: large repetitive protein, partial [Thermoleophilaceae bacterium]|nr:large repetitive protein [Thermoleophilaceae bacterium]